MSDNPTGQAVPDEGAASPPSLPDAVRAAIERNVVDGDLSDADVADVTAGIVSAVEAMNSPIVRFDLAVGTQARYFDAVKHETVALHVDTERPDHVLFQTMSALDAVGAVLDRDDVEQLHAQLGAWLAVAP